jgi:hypothetical protein
MYECTKKEQSNQKELQCIFHDIYRKLRQPIIVKLINKIICSQPTEIELCNSN